MFLYVGQKWLKLKMVSYVCMGNKGGEKNPAFFYIERGHYY